MKKTLVLIAVITMAAGLVFADDQEFYGFPEGDWTLRGARLYQTDQDAPRAKAWLRVPQTGAMIYEFTMRYQGGGEDGHGGAGIHILSDSRTDGKAWGFGESWLLWLNYDRSPKADGIPSGLSAILYRSSSDTEMTVVKAYDLNAYSDVFMDYLSYDIPVKLTVYPDQGRIIIADPRGESAGWYINAPRIRGADGSYVAVRTNGAAVSFTSPDVNL